MGDGLGLLRLGQQGSVLGQPCVSDGVFLVSSFRKEKKWQEEGKTGRNERLREKRRKGR